MTYGNWLSLIDGSQYWLNPKRNDKHALAFTLAIEGLAKQLSQINRFNGATSWPYSVAQHSVWCSERLDVDAEWALAALFHDAHEVIVSDIARPVKSEIKDRLPVGHDDVLRKIADEADQRILPAFGIKWPLPPQVKAVVAHVDDVALATEKRDLLSDVGHQWADLPAPHPDKLKMMTADHAAKAFVERFNALTARLGKPVAEAGDDAGVEITVAAEAGAGAAAVDAVAADVRHRVVTSGQGA